MSKWTKVYSGPGYPLDPKLEEQRMRDKDPEYLCEMIPKRPKMLRSEEVTLTFGSQEEADAWLRMWTSYQRRNAVPEPSRADRLICADREDNRKVRGI